MADSKGTDPKANEAKASDAKAGDVRSGAVKPPVLDLTARSVGAESAKPEPAKPAAATPGAAPSATAGTASAGKPAGTTAPGAAPSGFAAAADKAKAGDKPADKPRPAAAAPVPAAGFGFGAALVGGLLGLGAAYGLAYAGLWPAAPVETVAADPRLAAYGRAIPELETVTQTTQAELATLKQRVAMLERVPDADAPSAPAAGPDLAGDLAALSARIDSLAQAEAPAVDTTALDGLRSDFAALGGRIDELAARLGTAESGLRSLDSSVTETTAALAAQPSDIGAVLALPLILSGFETAFATGRPYETELAALRSAAPDAVIPTRIANQAVQGLIRPDEIARRFDAVLPAILAGRPADPNAPWQTGALDWFAGAIALRPTDEMAGDTPEAIASRLIGAVERREFASALALLESLPAPMQAAAGDVPALLAEQAEAETFLQDLRDAALGGEVAR
ncbi:COG4223 family protein [Devosia beringensis]|uniref:COG4223 family protein n=1 Tax=Devosia beringensis TaxID=2657486 RepID=UPI00186B5A06|nr:hypothetical protein [Devosia beringensis]